MHPSLCRSPSRSRGLSDAKNKNVAPTCITCDESEPSERYAIAWLARRQVVSLEPVVTEEELIRVHAGHKVPEGIFANMLREGGASVEVKRLVSLAHADGFYAGSGFVWASTVRAAMDKAHAGIVRAHNVTDHHVVLCVPEDRRTATRLARHAARVARGYASSGESRCAARRVHVHVLPTPTCVM